MWHIVRGMDEEAWGEHGGRGEQVSGGCGKHIRRYVECVGLRQGKDSSFTEL